MQKITDNTQGWAKKRKAVEDGKKELWGLECELEHLRGARYHYSTKRQKRKSNTKRRLEEIQL